MVRVFRARVHLCNNLLRKVVKDADEGSFQAKASDPMVLRWLFAVAVEGRRTAQARDRKEGSEVEAGVVPKAESGCESAVGFRPLAAKEGKRGVRLSSDSGDNVQ